MPDLSILSEALAQAGLMPLVESTQAPGAPGLTIFAPRHGVLSNVCAAGAAAMYPTLLSVLVARAAQ